MLDIFYSWPLSLPVDSWPINAKSTGNSGENGMPFYLIRFMKWFRKTCIELSLGDNTIISNIMIPLFLFDYDIENLFKLLKYRQIAIKKIYIAIKKQIGIVSRVRNSMETNLGQCFQLSEVRSKSELLQWLADCWTTKELPNRVQTQNCCFS